MGLEEFSDLWVALKAELGQRAAHELAMESNRGEPAYLRRCVIAVRCATAERRRQSPVRAA